MSHDQLRALMEHAEEAGCVNLSSFTQAVTELELDDEEVAALYEQLERSAGSSSRTTAACRTSPRRTSRTRRSPR